LFLDDEGRAYEAAGRNEFREISFDEALARVEEPLKELGETLETAYDDAYVSRKDATLQAAGIQVLRLRIRAGRQSGIEHTQTAHTQTAVAGGLRMR